MPPRPAGRRLGAAAKGAPMHRCARHLLFGFLLVLLLSAGAAGLPRAAAGPVADDPQTAELLAYGGRWDFGRVGSAAPLCSVVLTRTAGRHGLVLRACNANEAFWRLDRGKLVFLSAAG